MVRFSSSSPVYLFLFWNSVERILAVGLYYSDFRVIRTCLVGIPPLYHSFDLPYTCPVMHTSFGPNRSSSLHIVGRPAKES